MIHKRKYLYGREQVGQTLELDYLKTGITSADFNIERDITITDATEFRVDLLSKEAFGSYHFGWLLMDFNDIVDPYEELYSGRVLKVPSIADYFQFYSRESKISKERKK